MRSQLKRPGINLSLAELKPRNKILVCAEQPETAIKPPRGSYEAF
jgi:hypothetical protein